MTIRVATRLLPGALHQIPEIGLAGAHYSVLSGGYGRLRELTNEMGSTWDS